MGDELAVGVVGVRNNGRGHARRIRELEGVRLVALADVDAERLKEAAEELEVDEAYGTAEDLFASDGMDAVVLSVPNHLHAPLTVEALEAGKDVLVEKPIARTVEEAERMIEARDRAGRVLMVGMDQRFSPRVYGLREVISSGGIGEVYLARARWTAHRVWDGLWGRGAWGVDAEKSGGGPLLDLGIHKLDLALHLMGFPRAVSVDGVCFRGLGRRIAEGRGRGYDVEDHGIAFVRLEGGAVVTLEAAYFVNDPDGIVNDCTLHGTEGVVRVPDAWHATEEGELTEVEPTEPADAPSSSAEHFRNVLLGREELSSTAEEALAGLRICRAVYESSEKGEAVEL